MLLLCLLYYMFTSLWWRWLDIHFVKGAWAKIIYEHQYRMSKTQIFCTSVPIMVTNRRDSKPRKLLTSKGNSWYWFYRLSSSLIWCSSCKDTIVDNGNIQIITIFDVNAYHIVSGTNVSHSFSLLLSCNFLLSPFCLFQNAIFQVNVKFKILKFQPLYSECAFYQLQHFSSTYV